MTKLYINTGGDWLDINSGGDWLLVDSGGSVTPDYPTTPGPIAATVTSYSPAFVSVTHGLKRQVRSRGGHAWQIEFRYGGMVRKDAESLLAFLTKQAGPFGTFTVSLPAITLMGTGSGTPRINGAGQSGTSLTTDGWSNNSAVLKAGDWIQIENDPKVYKVTANVTSDGSGNATIPIFPSLRLTPADNALLSTDVLFTCSLDSETLAVDWDHCSLALGFAVSMVEV